MKDDRFAEFGRERQAKFKLSSVRDGLRGFVFIAEWGETDGVELLEALRLIPEPRPPIVQALGEALTEQVRKVSAMRKAEGSTPPPRPNH